MSTCATPGTRIRRWLIFQYAVDDSWVRSCSLDETPIFMTRLVAETGGIMNGGLAHRGSAEVTCAIRSCTSWRDRSSSVPRLKTSRIDDSCETDLERTASSPGRPLS